MVLKWADFHLSAELLHQHYKGEMDGHAGVVIFYHLTAILRFVLEDFAQTIIQIMFLVNNNSTNPTVITSIVVGLLMSGNAARKAGGAMFKARHSKSGKAMFKARHGKSGKAVETASTKPVTDRSETVV
jgi:hypothetical protein